MVECGSKAGEISHPGVAGCQCCRPSTNGLAKSKARLKHILQLAFTACQACLEMHQSS